MKRVVCLFVLLSITLRSDSIQTIYSQDGYVVFKNLEFEEVTAADLFSYLSIAYNHELTERVVPSGVEVKPIGVRLDKALAKRTFDLKARNVSVLDVATIVTVEQGSAWTAKGYNLVFTKRRPDSAIEVRFKDFKDGVLRVELFNKSDRAFLMNQNFFSGPVLEFSRDGWWSRLSINNSADAAYGPQIIAARKAGLCSLIRLREVELRGSIKLSTPRGTPMLK